MLITPLAIDDLFAAGLGFDIAGAYLFGRGLLASPGDIARRSVAYWDFSAPEAVAQARDRVDAFFGMGALLIGFTLQALGYVLLLLGEGRDATGLVRAVVAAGCAIAAVGLTLGVSTLLRMRLMKSTLVKVAHFRNGRQRAPLPSAIRLVHFGQELGVFLTAAEATAGGGRTYARRVFGVDEVDEVADLIETVPTARP